MEEMHRPGYRKGWGVPVPSPGTPLSPNHVFTQKLSEPPSFYESFITLAQLIKSSDIGN